MIVTTAMIAIPTQQHKLRKRKRDDEGCNCEWLRGCEPTGWATRMPRALGEMTKTGKQGLISNSVRWLEHILVPLSRGVCLEPGKTPVFGVCGWNTGSLVSWCWKWKMAGIPGLRSHSSSSSQGSSSMAGTLPGLRSQIVWWLLEQPVGRTSGLLRSSQHGGVWGPEHRISSLKSHSLWLWDWNMGSPVYGMNTGFHVSLCMAGTASPDLTSHGVWLEQLEHLLFSWFHGMAGTLVGLMLDDGEWLGQLEHQ